MNAETPLTPKAGSPRVTNLPAPPPRGGKLPELRDQLYYDAEEIKQGLDHILGAHRREDGKRTAYWVGEVTRRMANLSKEVLRAAVERAEKEKGSIITP